MRFSTIPAVLTLLFAGALAIDKPINIEVTHANECAAKSKKGDKIQVHYRGTLEKDGSEFDASYNRGQPLHFKIGSGQVIKGWEEGLLDMCPGDKRTLTIQPEYGYGKGGMGPIPGNSVLIFETEMVTVNGQGVEEPNRDL